MADFNESVSSTLGLGFVINVSKHSPDPNIPLVIIDGKVQQNASQLDQGSQVTRFVDSNYTTVFEDRVIIATSPLTVSLMPAADFAYRRLDVKSRATGDVIIDADGAELIDDDSTQTISIINDSLALISDGVQWFTIGGGGGAGSGGPIITETDFDDPTHYYYGGTDAGDWFINRYDKPGGTNKETANEGNNGAYSDLSSAWAVRTSLTYA